MPKIPSLKETISKIIDFEDNQLPQHEENISMISALKGIGLAPKTNIAASQKTAKAPATADIPDAGVATGTTQKTPMLNFLGGTGVNKGGADTGYGKIIGVTQNAPEGTTAADYNTNEQLRVGTPADKIAAMQELTPEKAGKQMYERKVFQPVKNLETGNVEYKQIATEMSTTPGDKYLGGFPQSTELPIANQTANTLGDADTLLRATGTLKSLIQGGTVGTTEAWAQKTFNPTSFFKSQDVAKFNDAQFQIQNMLLNLRSGAAVTPQEYERLNLEINPKAGDTVKMYLNRLSNVDEFIKNRVKYLGLTKKELVANAKPDVSSVKQEVQPPAQEKTIMGKKYVLVNGQWTAKK
jgi:hypothetical protein